MSKYDEYLKAKAIYDDAVEWNELPNGERYTQSDTFNISVAHCKLELKRRGAEVRRWNSVLECAERTLRCVVRNYCRKSCNNPRSPRTPEK